MKFFLMPSKKWLPAKGIYKLDQPYALLRHDNWDDYGYRTSFELAIYDTQGIQLFSSYLKILQYEPTDFSVDVHHSNIPNSEFEELPTNFCSLGNSLDYYETLRNLEENIWQSVLIGLRDVVYLPDIVKEIEQTNGFRVSLLRDSDSEKAFREGHQFFSNREVFQLFKFDFSCRLEGAGRPHLVSFDFTEHPSRLNRSTVLIGKNGTGKTRYLAEFAHAMSGMKQVRGATGFSPRRPSFSRVIAISCSVFDDFERPLSSNHGVSYIYCGIRAPERQTDADSNRLMSQDETRAQIFNALQVIKDQDRDGLCLEILSILLEGAVDVDELSRSESSFYEKLSSGQRILVLVLTQTIAFIRQHSILLVDEPELHLHPEVFAALARALSRLLVVFDSFAIIATHSPMLLQETMARQVRVFKRIENIPEISELAIECFGENLTTITREVFEVDGSEHNFRGHLLELMKESSAEEIGAMFPLGLPMLAQAFIDSHKTRRNE